MPLLSIFFFLVIFCTILLAGIFIYTFIQNKNSLAIKNKFAALLKNQPYEYFPNLSIHYREMNGLQSYAFPNSSCELYVFDNFIVVNRSFSFVLKVNFPPEIITSNTSAIEKQFSFLKSLQITECSSGIALKGRMTLKLHDNKNKNYKIELVFKKLKDDVANKIENIFPKRN